MVSQLTERLGVNYAATIFASYGWLFREQFIHDFGIDAHVEILDAAVSYPTGKLLALQIKSGKSFFEEAGPSSFIFRPEKKHVEYWLNHTMPVLVLFYHPDEKAMYWQQVTKENLGKSGKGWKLTIPTSQRMMDGVVPTQFAEMVQPEPYIQRLNRLRLDVPWMKLLQKHEVVAMEFDDWVNKSLPRYQVTMTGGGEIQRWPLFYEVGCTLEDLLQHFIPWADYDSDLEAYKVSLLGSWEAECYVGTDPETGRTYYGETFAEWFEQRPVPGKLVPIDKDGEVRSYRLLLKLNAFGRAFLKLNTFLHTQGRMEKGTFTEKDLLLSAKKQSTR